MGSEMSSKIRQEIESLGFKQRFYQEENLVSFSWKKTQPKTPNKTYLKEGREYTVIGKMEKYSSFLSPTRIKGILLGTCLTFGSFGLLLFFKSVRELFTGRQVLRILKKKDNVAKIEQQVFPQIRGFSFTKLKTDWDKNAANKQDEANAVLLENLIKDKQVSDDEVLQCLQDLKIRPQGGWFQGNGQPTPLQQTLLDQRPDLHKKMYPPKLVSDVNKVSPFAKLKTDWDKNAANQQAEANAVLLQDLIQNKQMSDDEVLQCLQDLKIRPQGGWFQEKNGKPTPLQQTLLDQRPNLHKKMYPPALVSDVNKVSASLFTDPVRYLITINCHGLYTNETFELPANVYVLIPHPNGLDTPYMLSAGHAFEPSIYQSKGDLPTPSSGGWRLYKPKELIRNLYLSPWSGSSNEVKEFQSWMTKVPEADIQLVSKDGSVPPFAVVPARGNDQKLLNYAGKAKNKVKVFGKTNLQAVVKQLAAKSPQDPIVLIPFTCNATKGNDTPIWMNMQKTISAASLFT